MKKFSVILIAVLLISLLCSTAVGAEAKIIRFQGAKNVTLTAEAEEDGYIFARLLDGNQSLIAVKAFSIAQLQETTPLGFDGKTGSGIDFIWLDDDLRPVTFAAQEVEGPTQNENELPSA